MNCPFADLFQKAGQTYGLDPVLLAAICSRESGFGAYLTTKGPDGTGDNGNGLGLMQIDRRAHPDFAALNWQDPETNIRKGAEILRGKFDDLAWFATVAGYNADSGHLKTAIDGRTTGGNYASDVFRRRDELAKS